MAATPMLKGIISGMQSQISGNGSNINTLQGQTNSNSSSITALQGTSASQQTQITTATQSALTSAARATADFHSVGFALSNVLAVLSANSLVPPIPAGRQIVFSNNTAASPLDLYVTVGGAYAAPLQRLTTLAVGATYGFPISATYNWDGNFNVLPAGANPPTYNAGPSLFEIGVNQIWSGATPVLRDTFDISNVPPGIGTGVNNGPRALAVQLSQAAGFSVQQSYAYNCGIEVIPPVGATLMTQTVTATSSNGNSANSIGYPNDTAYPKQQTGDAVGSYLVRFRDPVVSLP